MRRLSLESLPVLVCYRAIMVQGRAILIKTKHKTLNSLGLERSKDFCRRLEHLSWQQKSKCILQGGKTKREQLRTLSTATPSQGVCLGGFGLALMRAAVPYRNPLVGHSVLSETRIGFRMVQRKNDNLIMHSELLFTEHLLSVSLCVSFFGLPKPKSTSYGRDLVGGKALPSTLESK